MSKIISSNCQKALDALISEDSARNATSDIIGHAINCPDCHALIDAVSSIKSHGSLYAGEKYPDLKNKILQKIEIELSAADNTQTKPVTITNPLTKYIPFWLRFSLSFAIVIGVLVYILSTFAATNQAPTIKPKQQNIISASAKKIEAETKAQTNTDYYTVSFNGKKSEQVSIDEPVMLLNNEIASVDLPDGSKAILHGTAKLVIHPRGVHLVEGKVEINVSKSDKQFAATTPHGRIVAFGTSFSVDVSKLETDVYVKAGKARVTPDRGKGTIINSEEYFVMKRKSLQDNQQIFVPQSTE